MFWRSTHGSKEGTQIRGFLQYWMQDVVQDFTLFGAVTLPDAQVRFGQTKNKKHTGTESYMQAATSMFLLPLLLGATAAALTAGVLSDRLGRKIMVYAGQPVGVHVLSKSVGVHILSTVCWRHVCDDFL